MTEEERFKLMTFDHLLAAVRRLDHASAALEAVAEDDEESAGTAWTTYWDEEGDLLGILEHYDFLIAGGNATHRPTSANRAEKLRA